MLLQSREVSRGVFLVYLINIILLVSEHPLISIQLPSVRCWSTGSSLATVLRLGRTLAAILLGRTSSIAGLGIGRVDRGTLVNRYRVWSHSGVARAGRLSRRRSRRFLLAKEAAKVLGIDEPVGVEQATGTTCSWSNSQPLVDVGSDLLLHGIGHGVLDATENTTEESTRWGGRFLRRDHNVTTGAVKLSGTSVATTGTTTATTTVVIVAT